MQSPYRGLHDLHGCMTAVGLQSEKIRKSTRHQPSTNLQNRMAKQAASEKPRVPNAGSWKKGGASPNPNGRPRTGLAAAEKIRELVDPAEWVAFELETARDATIARERRSAAWHALIDRGFVKPEQRIDARVAQQDASQHDFDSWPVERLRALTEMIDAPLGEQPNAVESQPIETTTNEVKQ